MSYDCSKWLGTENLGPRQLTESDRFEIECQVSEHLLSKGAFPHDAIIYDLLQNSGDRPCHNAGIYKSADGGSLVAWVARKLNKEPKSVIEDVLNEQGIDCKTLFGDEGEQCKNGIPRPLTERPQSRKGWIDPPQSEHVLRACRVPREFPEVLKVGGALYRFSDGIPISAKNGEFIGGIAVYRSNNHPPIMLPLRGCMHDAGGGVAQPRLMLGWSHKTFPFANEDCLLKQPTAPVLLCLDLAVAMIVTTPHHENKLPEGVIPTCHFGGTAALDRVNWEALYMRDVLIIPASTRESYADAHVYATKLLAQGARSVRICLNSLLPNPKPECGDDVNTIYDPLVRHIVTHALEMAVASLMGLIQKVLNKTLSPEEFKAWGSENGLFAEAPAPEINNGPFFQYKKYLSHTGLEPVRVSLQDIFPSDGIALVHAFKNAGKSLSMLEILRGKINGEGAFGFEGSGTPEACLLLDSETPPTVFANRLEQMGLAGEIQNRFFPISKRDPKAAYPWDCFNILNEDHRKALEHLMDQHHIGNFTLDNLTSVCAPGKLYSPQSAGIVLDWAGTLTRQGVGVLLLHHTLEGSERGRGTEEWGIRCTTEIMLIGRKQILKSKQYPAVVGEHARRKGFTAGLYFKSCKAAPSLEENILWFHCPLNGTEFTLIEKTAADGSEILEDEVSVNDTLLSTEINEEPGVESVEDVESILSLIPEEHLPALEAMKPAERDEVLKVLEMAQHRHEGFTVKNAKGWLECADTKAQDRLKVLMDFGLLDRLGQASSTRYKIRAR